jgi:hypothetical protein
MPSRQSGVAQRASFRQKGRSRRGGEARTQIIALNRDDPAAIDKRFLGLKPALEEAVKDHVAL